MPPPQPARVTRAIETWFSRHQRPLPWRSAYDPYHVWVSEVMLQQTRMEVVLGYFERFLERFPTLHDLAAASEDEVVAAWSGLGYYRRARMLREGAKHVVTRLGGRIPDTVEELLTIPGIGRYTAGAIASIAHRKKAPIVDGNVTRVLARLFALEDSWTLAERLVTACKDPRAFNQGLMEIGALICKPRNPLCLTCPLTASCVAYATNRVDEFPAPKEKPATRALTIPLYLVTDPHGRVLMRRESGKLMNAMYHLPHGDTSLLAGQPLAIATTQLLGKFRHTVTTRRIEFQLFAATLQTAVRESPEEYAWIHPDDMGAVPHPSYVKKALRLARNGR